MKAGKKSCCAATPYLWYPIWTLMYKCINDRHACDSQFLHCATDFLSPRRRNLAAQLNSTQQFNWLKSFRLKQSCRHRTKVELPLLLVLPVKMVRTWRNSCSRRDIRYVVCWRRLVYLSFVANEAPLSTLLHRFIDHYMPCKPIWFKLCHFISHW